MPRSPLPTQGEPLVLANGIHVEPAPPPVVAARIAIPHASEAQRLVGATRRKIAELPLDPKQMNAVGALLVYTAFGLSNDEICVATGITHDQLNLIRDSAAYTEMEKSIIGAVTAMTKQHVQDVLAGAEKAAADKIVGQVQHGNPDVAYRAAKDVLDRRGHAPKQQLDIRAQMMSNLRIEVVDKRGPSIPTIDMEVEHAADH